MSHAVRAFDAVGLLALFVVAEAAVWYVSDVKISPLEKFLPPVTRISFHVYFQLNPILKPPSNQYTHQVAMYTIEGTDCSDAKILIPIDARTAGLQTDFHSEMVRAAATGLLHRKPRPLRAQVFDLDLSRRCRRDKSLSPQPTHTRACVRGHAASTAQTHTHARLHARALARTEPTDMRTASPARTCCIVRIKQQTNRAGGDLGRPRPVGNRRAPRLRGDFVVGHGQIRIERPPRAALGSRCATLRAATCLRK
jgi:hypothetical protein